MAQKQCAALSNGAVVTATELIPAGVHRYTLVDVAADSTSVSAAPAMLYSVHVNTALSAHACPIADASTTVFSLAASSAVGTNLSWPKGIPFLTSLVVDPNDAATGSITLVWAPL